MMEEMSPAVSLTLSLGNPKSDSSVNPGHVEFTRLKLVTDTVNLFSASSPESGSIGNGSCHDFNGIVDSITVSQPTDNGQGIDSFWGLLPKNGTNLTVDKEGASLATLDDPDEMIDDGLFAIDGGSSINVQEVVKIGDVANGHIVAKAIILVESGKMPTSELIVATVSPDLEVSASSELNVPAVVFQSKGGIVFIKAFVVSLNAIVSPFGGPYQFVVEDQKWKMQLLPFLVLQRFLSKCL